MATPGSVARHPVKLRNELGHILPILLAELRELDVCHNFNATPEPATRGRRRCATGGRHRSRPTSRPAGADRSASEATTGSAARMATTTTRAGPTSSSTSRATGTTGIWLEFLHKGWHEDRLNVNDL